MPRAPRTLTLLLAGLCVGYAFNLGASPASAAPTCQERRLQISQVLNAPQTCKRDRDCVTYSHSCTPAITCGTPMNKSNASFIKSLVKKYAKTCDDRTCAGCAPAGKAVCRDRRCVAI
jgi:hypothetical protein